jgi:hypothetical protein
MSAQLASSPPFPLPAGASPLADVVTSPRRVTLSSHWDTMNSLPLLHLLTMLCPIASPLESKLKHWICTTAIVYPPRSSTLTLHYYKMIISTLITLPTTQQCLHFIFSLDKLKHHIIGALPTTMVPFYRCLTPIVSPHNDTQGDKVVDHLSLSEQLISMWIHVKRYFEMS